MGGAPLGRIAFKCFAYVADICNIFLGTVEGRPMSGRFLRVFLRPFSCGGIKNGRCFL